MGEGGGEAQKEPTVRTDVTGTEPSVRRRSATGPEEQAVCRVPGQSEPLAEHQALKPPGGAVVSGAQAAPSTGDHRCGCTTRRHTQLNQCSCILAVYLANLKSLVFST